MSEPNRGEIIPPTVEVHLTPDDLRAAMEADVQVGLTAEHKHLPCRPPARSIGLSPWT
jgi:hypothetical protein